MAFMISLIIFGSVIIVYMIVDRICKAVERAATAKSFGCFMANSNVDLDKFIDNINKKIS